MTALGWLALALFFTYMAVDDGAEIHESFGSAFDTIHKNKDPAGAFTSWASGVLDIFPSYTWLILFMPFFGAAGLFILIFLWRELKTRQSRALVIIALVCLALAVCRDFVEGLDKKHQWNFHTMIRNKYDLEKYTVRHFSKSLEEFLEMLGITLFWVSFILYFKFLPTGRVCFNVTGKDQGKSIAMHGPDHDLQPASDNKPINP